MFKGGNEKMILYGILDHKAKLFVNAFPSVNDQTAIRSFEQLLSAPEDNFLNQSPSDYSLYRLCDVSSEGIGPLFESIVDGNSYSDAIIQTKRLEAAERRAEIMNKLKGGVSNVGKN